MSISLKVKLYGESYKIHRLHIKEVYIKHFQRIAIQLGEPLSSALLNVNFYEHLNIMEIQSIYNLSQSNFGGLINSENSQVEVWLGRRRIVKLKLDDLFQKQTLFPLHQIQFNKINTKLKSGIYLEEKEIGNIGVFETKIQKFEIDNLVFHLSEIAFTSVRYQLLNEIWYKKQNLQLIKSDTLLRYQRCFFQNPRNKINTTRFDDVQL